MNYYNKYLKYKNKYLNLKNMIGSGNEIKDTCSACVNSGVVNNIYGWHTRSCDRCLTKTKTFSKKLSKDAIIAQTYKDELEKQFIDSTNLTIGNESFALIEDEIKYIISALDDIILNNGLRYHRMDLDPMYHINIEDPIILKFINIYSLTIYKENILSTIASNYSVHYYSGNKYYKGYYMMKINENNLPRYPTEGSVEREELKKIILNTRKEINQFNRETAESDINNNTLYNIPHNLSEKDKDLLEFINKTALRAIKLKPHVYIKISTLSTDFKLYRISSIDPIYPEKSSEYFKEFEIIRNKLIEELNLHNKMIDLQDKDPKKFFNIHTKYGIIIGDEKLPILENKHYYFDATKKYKYTEKLQKLQKRLIDEAILENTKNIESIKDAIKTHYNDNMDEIDTIIREHPRFIQGLNLTEFINTL